MTPFRQDDVESKVRADSVTILSRIVPPLKPEMLDFTAELVSEHTSVNLVDLFVLQTLRVELLAEVHRRITVPRKHTSQTFVIRL